MISSYVMSRAHCLASGRDRPARQVRHHGHTTSMGYHARAPPQPSHRPCTAAHTASRWSQWPSAHAHHCNVLLADTESSEMPLYCGGCIVRQVVLLRPWYAPRWTWSIPLQPHRPHSGLPRATGTATRCCVEVACLSQLRCHLGLGLNANGSGWRRWQDIMFERATT